MKTRLNLIVLLLVLSLGIVSAAPPVTTVQQFTEGYLIEEIGHQYLTLGESYQYNFYVFNQSDGILMNDTLITCNFHLFNDSGIELFSGDTIYDSDGHWGVYILGGNFSSIGSYPYSVNCQDDLGGALAGIFEVNPTGSEIDISNAILYITMLAILFILLFFLIRNIFTTYNKTIQFSSVAGSYVVLHIFLLLLWKVSEAFLYIIPFIEILFRVLYNIVTIGYFIFFPVLFFFMLMNHFNEKQFGRLRKMGYSDEDIKFHQRRNKR